MADLSPQSDHIPGAARLSPGVFVGRQREMAELQAALDDAISGRGLLVMLAGEPGIGKTRTAQELAAKAEALGAQVLWGWCYEGEGAPPYWPWVQPIRSYVQGCDPERLQAEMDPGAADIADIVPEIRGKLPALELPPTLEPEQARFRLFDSITTFLKNASASCPLLIVLEDLHWSDHSSLMLWEFVSREISDSRVMLLGTYRDVEVGRRHPLSRALGALIREPNFRRVQLGGLSKQDAGRLVELSAGVTLAEPSLELIHSRTEGNPLFLSELVRLVGEESIGAADSWTSTLPEGVKDIIGRRLDRLSAQCNSTLTVASVIGREFDFRLLNILRGETTEDQLLEAMEEALAARVIEEPPGTMGRYQFTHALIQETLAQELSTTRRARLHARIGQALEELYGTNAQAHAAEMAHHFARAEAVLGTEKLVRHSLLAGEQALAAYAYEEALGHFQQALEAKGVPLDGTDSAPDQETASLLFGLGRAQAATLTREEIPLAVANLTRAIDYYARSEDVDRAVAIAECPIVVYPGFQTGIAQLIARALELTSPDSHEAGRLQSRYGIAMGQEESDYDAAQEAFTRAVDIAQSNKDAALEMRTLANAASVDMFHLHWNEAKQKALRALDLSHIVPDTQAEVIAHYAAFSGMHHAGENETARRYAVAMLPLAERLRDRYWLATAFSRNEIVHRTTGDWQVARDFSDKGLAVSPFDPRLLGCRVVLEYEVGEFAEGQVYLERLLEAMRLTAPGPTTIYGITAAVIPIVARITGVTETFDTAEIAANAVIGSSIAPPSFAGWASTGLALIAVQRENATAAREQYAGLEPVRGTMSALLGGACDRILALLSTTMGQFDQAVAHFEDALAICRRAGCRPELAWSCCDYADTLLQRNGPGDRAKAIVLLDEALAISTDLGMLPLKQRVTERLKRVNTRPMPAPAYPDGLTQREVEVLRLIATGKTDREIGEELVIGVRTVTTHVGNILGKTGSANRTEAAAYAVREGLV